MTPDQVGREIANRTYAALSGLGVTAVQFPTRGELPTLPCILIHWTGFALESGMPEQRWTCDYTGQILVATAGDGSTTYAYETTLNALIVPLADAWDPTLNRRNSFLDDVPGENPVDACVFQPPSAPNGQLGQLFIVNNKPYLGGVVTWTAEFRRIAGEA